MDFIKENYHTGYEPKLDIDKYCYYADESNRNIMIDLISDYRKNELCEDENRCRGAIERFTDRLNSGPVFTFFEPYRVAYDNLSQHRNIEATFAAETDYNVIKLDNRNLMTIE